MNLSSQFSAYAGWRASLGDTILRLRAWLHENDLADAQVDLRLDRQVERLHEDKLQVAFVAEFSRGKSELINAIFFADYGTRILPSSAGRTTMCPTELHYDPSRPPQIELLPIDTRTNHASIAEFKRYPEEWRLIPLDTTSADAMHEALTQVSEQKWVTRDIAEKLGFAIDETGDKGLKPDVQGMVSIPAWRHAVINFPHPLLQQGLVILDTPGLNAIGAEPELTLSLLPNAHAVLFILAADTGVTQSDMAVWRDHVNGAHGRHKGRIVVLNKIDGLWDGLRPDAEIDAEIAKQVRSVRRYAGSVCRARFPGIGAEGAGGQDQRRRRAAGEEPHAATRTGADARTDPGQAGNRRRRCAARGRRHRSCAPRNCSQSRLLNLREQLQELSDLRGKNQGVIEYMMRKVKSEKDEFERGLQQYYAVRSVFTTLTNKLYGHLGMDAIREETRRTREAMLEAVFSKGLRDAMTGFFRHVRGKFAHSRTEAEEITRMLEAMYKRFSVEHGLRLTAPTPLSMLKYGKEIDRLEDALSRHVNTVLNILTLEKRALTQKFFETIAVHVRRTFEIANRDVEVWLRAVMAPLETQVREYQIQLKRRLESVRRIHQATDTLEERIQELTQMESTLLHQLAELNRLASMFRSALQPTAAPDAMAA